MRLLPVDPVDVRCRQQALKMRNVMDEKKPLLLILGLAMLTASRVASATVVVAEPTGDAGPAFLAEVKASLETVAAEAPPETNAELRSSASNNEAGWDLVVALVPNDGRETIRETRIVSKASALPQARAMGRAAIRALVATPPAPIASKPKIEETAIAEAVAESLSELSPSLKTETEACAVDTTPQRYNRKAALLISALPTSLLVAGGSVLFGVGWVRGEEFLITGGVVVGTALIFGPMPGWFYVGRWRHTLLMSTLRIGLVGTGVFSFIMWLNQGESNSDVCNIGDDETTSQDCSHNPFGMIYAASAFAATVFIDIIDIALLGRAADRANEQYRKSLEVRIAPVAWANRSGRTAFGLAFNGTF